MRSTPRRDFHPLSTALLLALVAAQFGRPHVQAAGLTVVFPVAARLPNRPAHAHIDLPARNDSVRTDSSGSNDQPSQPAAPTDGLERPDAILAIAHLTHQIGDRRQGDGL